MCMTQEKIVRKPARLVVFDVETMPTQNQAIRKMVEQTAREKRPAMNTAKALKKTWDAPDSIERRADEAFKDTALDVLLAELACLCAIVVDADGTCHELRLSMMPAFEFLEYGGKKVVQQTFCKSDLLEALSDVLNQLVGQETIWVGHNILGFDLAVLLNNFRRTGVRPPDSFPAFDHGRWYGRTYDTMRRTPCGHSLGLVSLENACLAYGLPPAKSVLWENEPMHGGRVWDLVLGGNVNTLMEYCMTDVRATLTLYLAQTCVDSWGVWGVKDDSVAGDVAAIENDPELTRAAKDRCILTRLEQAGLVPRLAV